MIFRNERHKIYVDIEVCDRVTSFSGWMRNFLAQLEACPYLFCLEKYDEKCPMGCYEEASKIKQLEKQQNYRKIINLPVPAKKLKSILKKPKKIGIFLIVIELWLT